jgi:cellulose synthase/poly-beta-1,6-N-acetylglucosamine synthase-like glycosyltransferase
MHFIAVIFWVCLFVIFYNYFGYGLLLLLFTGIKKWTKGKEPTTKVAEEYLPEVTVVVAAYNEEGVIREKIANCLSLNYPFDKISFLFITDGSKDNTPAVVSGFAGVKLLHEDERRGKTAALNRAMRQVKTPITVFCDANAMLNRSAIKRLVSHYQNPKVGGVSGEKKVFARKTDTVTGMGEGLYWKYESLLKMLDAGLYTVTGAAGELFSIRTDLWEELPEDAVLDDFVISARINLKGYRIAYEPSAYAGEQPSASIEEERKRKIRLSAGAFQAMIIVKELFNFVKHPVLFFQFFSHRFLRWTLVPLSIPMLLAANFVLIAGADHEPFYTGMFVVQLIFYLFAIRGFSGRSDLKGEKVSKICYYVLFMNYAVYLGFIRFVKGEQSAIWEKAQREMAMAGDV